MAAKIFGKKGAIGGLFGKKAGRQIRRFGRKAVKGIKQAAGGVGSVAGRAARVLEMAGNMPGEEGAAARMAAGILRGVQTGAMAVKKVRGNPGQVATKLVRAGLKARGQMQGGMM